MNASPRQHVPDAKFDCDLEIALYAQHESAKYLKGLPQQTRANETLQYQPSASADCYKYRYVDEKIAVHYSYHRHVSRGRSSLFDVLLVTLNFQTI